MQKRERERECVCESERERVCVRESEQTSWNGHPFKLKGKLDHSTKANKKVSA